MAQSLFKKKNREIVGNLVDQLISHVTSMEPDDENFEIAQNFIHHKLENHSFPEPNETLIKRQMNQLKEKFVLHSQDERANRLQYLMEEFLKRRTFKQVGISDSHMCILNLLQCLSVNPTGAIGPALNTGDDEDEVEDPTLLPKRDFGIGGVHDTISTKIYMSKQQVEQINQEILDAQLKELEESDEWYQIQLVRRQWQRELQAEEGDSSYDDEDDEFDLQDERAKIDHDEGQTQVNKVYDIEDGKAMAKQIRIKERQATRQLQSDPQTVFGGLPIHNDQKIPIIKSAGPNKVNAASKPQDRIKKFSLNQFLDKYLEDNQQSEQQDDELNKEKQRIENEMRDQLELKKLLNIKTFPEIQSMLSQRFDEKNPTDCPILYQGQSKLNSNKSSMIEPNNLQRDLNKQLNPYNKIGNISDHFTTERKIVLNVLQMLSLPGLESETFARDPNQLNVLFKLRHSASGFTSQTCVSHLSRGALKVILEKFVWMANQLQKTLFLFRGIQVNNESLSTVIQALTFAFNKILGNFNQEIDDLTQILLLQAGQISKSQLTFSQLSSSRARIVFPNYEQEPLTLMRLEQLLEQKGLFSKIITLRDIMQEGILDFVAHSHHIHAEMDKDSDDPFGSNPSNNQLEAFLRLADLKEKQAGNAKKRNNLDQSQDMDNINKEYEQQNATFKKLVTDVLNQRQLPSANLNLKDIKPADRATYLLNFLFMQIQRDQLLVDSFQRNGNDRLNTLKECFLICLKPYIQILNDWICKGDDNLSGHDLKKEFFIKANHSLFISEDEGNMADRETQNSRKLWNESYVFRTINISKLLGSAISEFKDILFEELDDEQDDQLQEAANKKDKKMPQEHIEISCPIFLRPLMRQILSVGKSIKIVRFLENNNILYANKPIKKKKLKEVEEQAEIKKNVGYIQKTIDFQGIDYEGLSNKHAFQIRVDENTLRELFYQNQMDSDKDDKSAYQVRINKPISLTRDHGDVPSLAVKAIALNLIDRLTLCGRDDQIPQNILIKSYLDQQVSPFQLNSSMELPVRLMVSDSDQPDLRKIKSADDDVEMKMEVPEQDQDIDQQFYKKDVPANCHYSGLFAMPQPIRSIQDNQLQNKIVQNMDYQMDIDNKLSQYEIKKTSVKEEISTSSNSPKDDSAKGTVSFGNKKAGDDMVIGDKFKRINQLERQDFFNQAQQELSIYKHSIGQYQSEIAFDYYMSNINRGLEPKKTVESMNHNKIEFKNLTIENYVQDTILIPINTVFEQTSKQMLSKYLMSSTAEYCQLQDQISLLHKTYFLQGVPMHKFIANLFDSADRSANRLQNQLYLINGQFQESLSELLENQFPNLDKNSIMGNMNIQFEDGDRQRARMNLSSLEYLQAIRVAYNCEWPVEIIIDKQTIHRKYNRIFKLLIHIKYAKYLMQKRDFHFKQPNLQKKNIRCYSYAKNYQDQIDEMGARERLQLQNQQMLGQLMHRIQVFQQELLHFITTMDDYFMNRATHLECLEFCKNLHELSQPQKEHTGKLNRIERTTDIDDIIKMHDTYLQRIMQLCLLDTKSQELLRYIMEIVEICLQFRKLIRFYLIENDNPDQNSDDDDDIGSSKYDLSAEELRSRSKKIEENFNGIGILRFTSTNFTNNLHEFLDKIQKLRQKFKNHMMVLTTNLNKLTKTQSGKIILSYLLEILQRLNFNSYYITRDSENLPPIRM